MATREGWPSGPSRPMPSADCRGSPRLRPVVAFDDDEVGLGAAFLLCLRGLLFGGVPAVAGDLVGRELDHDVAAADPTLADLERPAAHEEAYAEFGEDRAVRRDVVL